MKSYSFRSNDDSKSVHFIYKHIGSDFFVVNPSWQPFWKIVKLSRGPFALRAWAMQYIFLHSVYKHHVHWRLHINQAWVWRDGSPMEFWDWLPQQPGSAECGSASKDGWSDDICNTKKRYICKRCQCPIH